MGEYDFLDKEFTFLKTSGGIRRNLWDKLIQHKMEHSFPNLYFTLDSYVYKFGLSFGIAPTYKGDSETIVDYRYYINNSGGYFDHLEKGIFYPNTPYKNRDKCLKDMIQWILYTIE